MPACQVCISASVLHQWRPPTNPTFWPDPNAARARVTIVAATASQSVGLKPGTRALLMLLWLLHKSSNSVISFHLQITAVLTSSTVSSTHALLSISRKSPLRSSGLYLSPSCVRLSLSTYLQLPGWFTHLPPVSVDTPGDQYGGR